MTDEISASPASGRPASDTSASDTSASGSPASGRQPRTGVSGPGFAPPAPPGPAPAPAYAPPPAGYGAQPGQPVPPVQPPAAYAGQQAQPGPQAQEHYWTPEGLASAPALPPERVGHGALLALIAIPVGVVLSAVIWKLGFVASLSGVVVSAGAAVLYARGSGGRVKKGIPVIALVIALGIVGSFFAAVAVDLWDVFPKLDPEISSTYPDRASFVRNNLFYPPVLKEYTRDIVLFVLFGVLGAFGTILRLVRMNASLQR